MIRAYSQRLSPPFSGQAQIAESDRARAITMDGQHWEIHFTRGAPGNGGRGYLRHSRSFFRIANVQHGWIRKVAEEGADDGGAVDERILELAIFLAEAPLPFPMADVYEYWLLDTEDAPPLALIFSCIESAQMATFPDHPEWAALSAAAMPVVRSAKEMANGEPPINYQVERLVAERAGSRPRAEWFHRHDTDPGDFPPLLLREDWQDTDARELCQRYLERQSPRLLMLHGLTHKVRSRMEHSAKANALEVERFHGMYPEIANPELMSTIRVEARLRSLNQGGKTSSPAPKRGKGILYV